MSSEAHVSAGPCHDSRPKTIVYERGAPETSVLRAGAGPAASPRRHPVDRRRATSARALPTVRVRASPSRGERRHPVASARVGARRATSLSTACPRSTVRPDGRRRRSKSSRRRASRTACRRRASSSRVSSSSLAPLAGNPRSDRGFRFAERQRRSVTDFREIRRLDGSDRTGLHAWCAFRQVREDDCSPSLPIAPVRAPTAGHGSYSDGRVVARRDIARILSDRRLRDTVGRVVILAGLADTRSP